MFDVNAIYGYIGVLKEKPEGDFNAYQERVKTAEIAFRSSLTQVALETDDAKKLILFIRDFNDLSETLRDFHPKTKAEKEQAEWMNYEAMKAEEAAGYIRRVQQDLTDIPQNNNAASTKNPQAPSTITKFEKRLQDYGDLLSVKDLTEIFGCTPRTITNWEQKGWIVNVAETSDELNAIGKRKRGQEKRYRKDAILRSVYLNERYQAQV